MSDTIFSRSQSNDPEMDLASERARNTFKFLWRELSWELRRIIPGVDFSAVKKGFPTDKQHHSICPIEHMWVGELNFDGINISGTLLNQPSYIKDLHQNDRVKFDYRDLSDWMYVMFGDAYGAFTVNLLRQRMTLLEREEHDAVWQINFGDPECVNIAPNYSFAEYQNSRSSEIPEHPASINMLAISEEQIQNLGTEIDDREYSGMTMLQYETLAGNLAQVQLLLKHGADRQVQNANGQTALDLARMFDWQKIVEILN